MPVRSPSSRRRELPEWLPSLEEALDACRPLQVNVEIKQDAGDRATRARRPAAGRGGKAAGKARGGGSDRRLVVLALGNRCRSGNAFRVWRRPCSSRSPRIRFEALATARRHGHGGVHPFLPQRRQGADQRRGRRGHRGPDLDGRRSREDRGAGEAGRRRRDHQRRAGRPAGARAVRSSAGPRPTVADGRTAAPDQAEPAAGWHTPRRSVATYDLSWRIVTMNVAVCVKQIPDTAVPPALDPRITPSCARES